MQCGLHGPVTPLGHYGRHLQPIGRPHPRPNPLQPQPYSSKHFFELIVSCLYLQTIKYDYNTVSQFKLLFELIDTYLNWYYKYITYFSEMFEVKRYNIIYT